MFCMDQITSRLKKTDDLLKRCSQVFQRRLTFWQYFRLVANFYFIMGHSGKIMGLFPLSARCTQLMAF